MSVNISECYPISAVPKTDEEKYILEEAYNWINDNAFKSSLGYDEHIENVVKLGRKNVPFIIEIMRENNHKEGMYWHFLLGIMCKLYEDEIKFEGYCPPEWCMNMFIQLYDIGAFNKDIES